MTNSVRSNSISTWLADPFRSTVDSTREVFKPTGKVLPWFIPAAIGIGLLVLTAVGWATNPRQFYFSYLVGWTFCLSIALGALFFLLINHLTRARWSIVLRRIPEALTWSFPVLAVLSVPILIGMHDLYHWTHVEVYDPADSHYDPILAGKRDYLNTPFFLVRLAVYFVAWTAISYRLYALSVRQDVDGDVNTGFKMRKVSAVGLAITAVTTSFASFDILMSLDPHWFSTIFGVYFFAASFWVAHAMIALIAILLQRRRGLRGIISPEHYHDLGKMMFGFTVFWAYIAFSQYMLIWYGNLPEETIWYRHRLQHGWEAHSAALLIAHFVIPFWVLLPRRAKRSVPVMSIMAVWFLVMNWFDFHWIAMPVLHPDQAGFHWMDFSAWLGLFGVFLGLVLFRLSRHSLVPQNDPNLAKSLKFANM
ncbi:MAG: hypothetical protein HKN37_10385 [Rhodothermales bacterium]|nr:hypothetical protein [Rhodothermales bacterium]